MTFKAQDAALFLQDGELCTVPGGKQIKVILDFPDAPAHFAGLSKPGIVNEGRPSMIFATADASLSHGDPVAIAGEGAFHVGSVRRTDDGVLSVAELTA